MDVKSLYTVIPNDEGLLALKHFFDRRTVLEPSTPTLLRLAELVLTLNCFSFDGPFYKQINGVAMGTKMGPSYPNLFVGFIEEQISLNYPGLKPDFLVATSMIVSERRLVPNKNSTLLFLMSILFILLLILPGILVNRLLLPLTFLLALPLIVLALQFFINLLIHTPIYFIHLLILNTLSIQFLFLNFYVYVAFVAATLTFLTNVYKCVPFSSNEVIL